jgi:hypothetical protein
MAPSTITDLFFEITLTRERVEIAAPFFIYNRRRQAETMNYNIFYPVYKIKAEGRKLIRASAPCFTSKDRL